MRTPKRKPHKYAFDKPDPHITKGKYDRLKTELERLKKVERPPTAREVKSLAELGDFSENAAYQIAKGKLRSINNRITKIEKFLNHAEIISFNKNSDKIGLGSTVTLEINDKRKTYKILGSRETNPAKGIISHNSPLGKSLMGKKKGDIVEVKIKDKFTEYKIIDIK